MNIYLDANTLRKARKLQANMYESNGRIAFDDEGNVTEFTSQTGQWMSPCITGCAMNFHTHPPDYDTLYPDHPSLQDYHYIYNATCSFKELGAHAIFTPEFIYIIWYNCGSLSKEMLSTLSLRARIDKVFDDLDDDRSTPIFRRKYAETMRSLGFSVNIFQWSDEIKLEIPVRKKYSSLYYKLSYISIASFIFYMYSRNAAIVIAVIMFCLLML